jgi:NAD(P)-dependent dehydrogenase (short-subunit alcohol dehydrogenase family)
MSRILITGSSDGLGLLAAKALINQRHQVVLHARNENRAQETSEKAPGAESVLTADLSSIEEIKQLALKANNTGMFDAVIHNAGIYPASAKETLTVNVLAPYILTCLIQKPNRLIYLGSDMHLQGHSKLENSKADMNHITYSDSKLHILMLSKAVARKWADVYSNTVNPGWVPTKMGGLGAPDDLKKGYETQVWLATSNDENARVSGHYFHHQKKTAYNPEADDILLQERLLDLCRENTGISFPE